MRAVAFAVESLGDGFGFVSVASHRVPPAPFPAGERVEAVVGDDVDALLALHDVGHRVSVDDFDANPKRHVAGLRAARRSGPGTWWSNRCAPLGSAGIGKGLLLAEFADLLSYARWVRCHADGPEPPRDPRVHARARTGMIFLPVTRSSCRGAPRGRTASASASAARRTCDRCSRAGISRSPIQAQPRSAAPPAPRRHVDRGGEAQGRAFAGEPGRVRSPMAGRKCEPVRVLAIPSQAQWRPGPPPVQTRWPLVRVGA